jgi:hypothetical protein
MKLKTTTLVPFVSLLLSAEIHAQGKMGHQGAFIDVGLGYRVMQSQANVSLSRMGTSIPASADTGNANSPLVLANLGYNFPVNSDYVLGFGLNASATRGHSTG